MLHVFVTKVSVCILIAKLKVLSQSARFVAFKVSEFVMGIPEHLDHLFRAHVTERFDCT